MTLLWDFSCLSQYQNMENMENMSSYGWYCPKISVSHFQFGYHQCNPSEVLSWNTCWRTLLPFQVSFWPQRLLPELSQRAENRTPSDTRHFSSSPIPVGEVTVWNQNTREGLVSPLPRTFPQLKYTSTQFEKPKTGRKACRFQLG